MEDLNIINQPDLADIYRTKMDHILVHKTNLNTFKHIDIIQNMFSDQN